MRALYLVGPSETLAVLYLGAHRDDIEIGAGGTFVGWIASGGQLEAHWCVLSAMGAVAGEDLGDAHDSAGACAFRGNVIMVSGRS
jgi:LmbE family N-acetylglucosaminyl deacetylase